MLYYIPWSSRNGVTMRIKCSTWLIMFQSGINVGLLIAVDTLHPVWILGPCSYTQRDPTTIEKVENASERPGDLVVLIWKWRAEYWGQNLHLHWTSSCWMSDCSQSLWPNLNHPKHLHVVRICMMVYVYMHVLHTSKGYTASWSTPLFHHSIIELLRAIDSVIVSNIEGACASLGRRCGLWIYQSL